MRLFLDYRPALKHSAGVGAGIDELIPALVAPRPAGEPGTGGLETSLFSSSLGDRRAGSATGELTGVTPVDCRLPALEAMARQQQPNGQGAMS